MTADLKALAKEIRNCEACPLRETRNRAVPGQGPGEARIMLVGEAPGKEEDATGRPFVGRSGRLLTEVMEECGMDRGEVFITNTVKCRPPGNRNPKGGEMETCKELWLRKQIELVDPEVIVLLGGVAVRDLYGKGKIKDLRGSPLKKDGRTYYVTYHPAAVLRFPRFREKLAEDLCLAMSG